MDGDADSDAVERRFESWRKQGCVKNLYGTFPLILLGVFRDLTSPICVLCDTGQDMTAAHLDECSALNDLNCIVKSQSVLKSNSSLSNSKPAAETSPHPIGSRLLKPQFLPNQEHSAETPQF
ncbi:hypothetical protein TNCV_1944381 [Trichonephila clavipes]|nr:hypothetical protein TNCV_1944381 [Trichonephila clavipes]